MGWFSSDSSAPVATTQPAMQFAPQPASSEQTYKPLRRDERQRCWEARDLYNRCLDRNDILDGLAEADKAEKSCGKESAKFEQDCATTWVTYFKQKRVADFQKAQQLRKLEADGAVPPQETGSPKSSWKLW